ncbi:MAG TPA: serine/threonine-protein kinase, partial [Thermoanaerobaculia bacterium]
LGQPVALKFLSSSVAGDAKRLERLYAEVRLARQVSHPNVCRVYDIGEVDGEHFLSMEYVEGEDLAALLRRIGRIPEQKGIEISRQVAAGLAAAHSKGIIHRDLKPSNIMLDERGLVRVSDFGLAALAETLVESHVIEGTPAYMAPEQLAGESVTHRSDIYALGLVMYEIFTGRRAFEAASVGELLRKRQESVPDSPLAITPDLNASLSRLIVRCLEPDPQSRPSSALQVAHALPGGDPVSAAIAAGETPSPDMLAAARDGSGMRPSRALACLLAIVLSLLIVGVAGRTTNIAAYVEPQPAEVLGARARDVASQFGYSRARNRAYGFEFDRAYLAHVAQTDKSRERWLRLKKQHPGVLEFWYRESPQALIPVALFTFARASEFDPPRVFDGEIALALDSSGNLSRFYAPTPQMLRAGDAKPVDWKTLGALTGLNLANFRATPPQWAPQAWGDIREARSGIPPEHGDLTLRLEAAANQGKLIDFNVITPWAQPWRDRQADVLPTESATTIFFVTIFVTLLVGAVVLARRNFRVGRGDRRGAFRLAFSLFALQLAIGVLTANHAAGEEEIGVLIQMTAPALLLATFTWVLYVGIEPYVRRYWPRALVSWNRLLLLQTRDPRLGRDALIGITLGTVMHAIGSAADVFVATTSTPEAPALFDPDLLLGSRFVAGELINTISSSVMSTLVFFGLLYIVRLVLRRDFIAIAAVGALVGIFVAIQSEHPAIAAPLLILNIVALMLAMTRIGIVAGIAWLFAGSIITSWPMVLDPASWAFGPTLLATAIIVAVATYAFRIALAGRPVFSDAVLEN